VSREARVTHVDVAVEERHVPGSTAERIELLPEVARIVGRARWRATAAVGAELIRDNQAGVVGGHHDEAAARPDRLDGAGRDADLCGCHAEPKPSGCRPSEPKSRAGDSINRNDERLGHQTTRGGGKRINTRDTDGRHVIGGAGTPL